MLKPEYGEPLKRFCDKIFNWWDKISIKRYLPTILVDYTRDLGHEGELDEANIYFRDKAIELATYLNEDNIPKSLIEPTISGRVKFKDGKYVLKENGTSSLSCTRGELQRMLSIIQKVESGDTNYQRDKNHR